MPTSAQYSSEYHYRPAPLVPHICTSLLNRTDDFYWEWRLGITTTGGNGRSKFLDSYHYGTLAYCTYFSIFHHLRLGPTDVVVDLGAGKGRVTCIAALHPVKQVIGVEIDPVLCSLGKANSERMRMRQAPVAYLCQSATDYRFEDVNVITLFNPFGSDTMNLVLARLEESLTAKPRLVRIAYGHPVLHAMLAAKPWLELYDCWTPNTWSRLKFPIYFYRTRQLHLADKTGGSLAP